MTPGYPTNSWYPNQPAAASPSVTHNQTMFESFSPSPSMPLNLTHP